MQYHIQHVRSHTASHLISNTLRGLVPAGLGNSVIRVVCKALLVTSWIIIHRAERGYKRLAETHHIPVWSTSLRWWTSVLLQELWPSSRCLYVGIGNGLPLIFEQQNNTTAGESPLSQWHSLRVQFPTDDVDPSRFRYLVLCLIMEPN